MRGGDSDLEQERNGIDPVVRFVSTAGAEANTGERSCSGRAPRGVERTTGTASVAADGLTRQQEAARSALPDETVLDSSHREQISARGRSFMPQSIRPACAGSVCATRRAPRAIPEIQRRDIIPLLNYARGRPV